MEAPTTEGTEQRAAPAALRTRVPWKPIIVVGVAYYLGARMGLAVALVEPSVTPLWPPTGIAVAAFLLGGLRLWPGVLGAALLVNLPLGPSPLAAILIATGNTLASVAAVILLRRLGAGDRIERLRDALGFVFVAALLAMGVSATVGTSVLMASGVVEASAFATTWSVWWAGDAMGVLAFTPVILAFRSARARDVVDLIRATEALILIAGSVLAAVVILHSELRLLYLLFPFIGYAAFRFEHRGATTIALLVTVIATHSAAIGVGAFATGSMLENMITLQVFNVGITSMALVLATIVRERRRAMDDVEQSRLHLEERVHQRTEELEEANARLRELDEMKNAFMTAVSHEMRTPLTVVRGIAETLKRPEVLEDEHLLVLMIERLGANAERLERLLTDLLDLDRLKRGVIEPQRRLADLRALAVTVIEHIEALDNHIIVETGSAIGCVDPAQVERIIENLVINAVKHTPPGATIWVRATRSEGGVCLEVEDDGQGISEQTRDQIFEPFVRGDTPSHAPGTGVGLALVARFAEAHGGTARAGARDGGGASFRVWLPDPPGAMPEAVPAATDPLAS